jgi:dTDP-4-dehydrorhamnose reductase
VINTSLELWGGVECTVNRVGDRYHDQLELTGHARRPDDLQRLAALGIRRVRYPVLWERVAPDGVSTANWTWSDTRLRRLRALGIAPIAGLIHHGSGPRYSTLLERQFPDRFAEYARAVAERYPWIDAYTPVNEPLTTARFCALYGHWFPHASSDSTFVRAVLHQCRATALAMRAIRNVNPSAQLVQTDDAGKTFSTPVLAYQARFENHRRWLAWDLLFGRVNPAHPLWAYLRASGATTNELGWFLDHPCPADIVGINYYLTSDRFLDERVDRYSPALVGTNGRDSYVDVEAVRTCRSISGHRAILEEAWRRYRTPVALTEVHLGCTREEQMRWMLEAWDSAHSARRGEVDVRAVTAWALFGLNDWDSLVTTLSGHYEAGAFDVRGSKPRPTALASLLSDLAAGRHPQHAALASSGWWRRRQRFLDAPRTSVYPRGFPPDPAAMRGRARVSGRRTILITGGRGTLATAFARICAARGLRCELSSRETLDIADPVSVAQALHRIRPWAIVNAAGYVRVDDAERAPDQCRRENTIGPQLLADACARNGIRLLTFSSDLVFDGTAGRPYLESDDVAPLSTYGRTKADAEQIVLEVYPGALIARTSALFGPWDTANWVHHALAAFASGESWQVPYDQRVSPTYVPDLVHASLDLLIDGASGIWHLANDGAVTWSELARRAAAASGYPEYLVEEQAGRAPYLALRPLYSVLGTERGRMLPPLDDALRRFVEERQRPTDRSQPAVWVSDD